MEQSEKLANSIHNRATRIAEYTMDFNELESVEYREKAADIIVEHLEFALKEAKELQTICESQREAYEARCESVSGDYKVEEKEEIEV